MGWKKQYLSQYPLLWCVSLLVLSALIWYWLYHAPAPPQFSAVNSMEVKHLGAEPATVPAPSIDERTGDLEVRVEGVELTLSSSDGKLKLHVWADQAVKTGAHYSINSGTLRFALENRDTLIVRVTDASFVEESNRVYVTGKLTGIIAETGQYFEAEELQWDRLEYTVAVAQVTFASQLMQVTGTQLEIDLRTGALIFHGLVEAGF